VLVGEGWGSGREEGGVSLGACELNWKLWSLVEGERFSRQGTNDVRGQRLGIVIGDMSR
jgi:hypothetical protein